MQLCRPAVLRRWVNQRMLSRLSQCATSARVYTANPICVLRIQAVIFRRLTLPFFSAKLSTSIPNPLSPLFPHYPPFPPSLSLFLPFYPIIMAALCNRAGHYIFALWFLLSSFFSWPNLSRHRLDVYHTSTYGVALVRI